MTKHSVLLLAGLSILFLVIGGALRGASTAIQVQQDHWPAYIHVQWESSINPEERQRLELMFGLMENELLEGTTYHYLLTDPTSANIEALVKHEAITDTQDIDRTTFRITPAAERVSPATQEPSNENFLLNVIGTSLAGLGLFFLGLTIVVSIAPRWVNSMPSRVQRGILAQIPHGSPKAVAVFRILFGAGVLLIPISQSSLPPDTGFIASIDSLLALRPFVMTWLQPWLWTWGILFIAGAITWLSFPALTMGFIVWALVFGHTHPITALALTLIGLLPSRWSDTWSVDAWWSRHQHTNVQRRSQEYGYTLWLPGVVLGMTFLAAAFAKLSHGGLGWVTNGTVKYHFMTDAAYAPVSWGAQLGFYPALAILVSLLAVSVEATAIFGALSKRYSIRAITGLICVSLLSGFWLFQAVFWPGWWLLLLAFLPWHLLGTHQSIATHVQAPVNSWRQSVQIVLVISFIAQQGIVSALNIEAPPLLSAYDMYSSTYENQEAYEKATTINLWIVANTKNDRQRKCQVSDSEAVTIGDLSDNNSNTYHAYQILETCFDDLRMIRDIQLEATRRTIDWSRWKLGGMRRVKISDRIRISGPG